MQGQQPRSKDENEEIEEQERAPSFLSARELQIPNPSVKGERAANDRDPFEEEEESENVENAQRRTPASANQKRSR